MRAYRSFFVCLPVAVALGCGGSPNNGSGEGSGGAVSTTTTTESAMTNTTASEADGGLIEPGLWWSSQNCIGSVPTSVAQGCNTQNPCVTGTVVDGQCSYEVAGVGTDCGPDKGMMQCWVGGGVCCPTASKPTCSIEGQQAECDSGSVCFEGACWFDCSVSGDFGCVQAGLGPFCNQKVLGSKSVYTCFN